MNTEQDFWSNVNVLGPDECWPWTGSLVARKDGWKTGRFHWRGKPVSAHRLAYELSKDKISTGKVIRHKCDFSLCCNPNHLETGTIADNNLDCRERGRHKFAIGSKQGSSKFTEEQVLEIRNKVNEGATKTSVAAYYGVSRYAIYWIMEKGWKHV